MGIYNVARIGWRGGLIPMTHAPETGAENRLHFFRRRFLVRVSCKSGFGFVWYYQIATPIRTLFIPSHMLAYT